MGERFKSVADPNRVAQAARVRAILASPYGEAISVDDKGIVHYDPDARQAADIMNVYNNIQPVDLAARTPITDETQEGEA